MVQGTARELSWWRRPGLYLPGPPRPDLPFPESPGPPGSCVPFRVAAAPAAPVFAPQRSDPQVPPPSTPPSSPAPSPPPRSLQGPDLSPAPWRGRPVSTAAWLPCFLRLGARSPGLAARAPRLGSHLEALVAIGRLRPPGWGTTGLVLSRTRSVGTAQVRAQRSLPVALVLSASKHRLLSQPPTPWARHLLHRLHRKPQFLPPLGRGHTRAGRPGGRDPGHLKGLPTTPP